jgi:hypothetical protein
LQEGSSKEDPARPAGNAQIKKMDVQQVSVKPVAKKMPPKQVVKKSAAKGKK